MQQLRNVRNSKYGHASEFGMSSENLSTVRSTIVHFVALCLPEQLQYCQEQIANACSQQGSASNIEANTVTAMGASFEALRQQFNQLQQTADALQIADALQANNITTQGAHGEGI